ncbi:hypothetical protein [Paenibacillus sp.]|uniref:hypothetical protein n=1 Tax=Paenibacillus sp. TaxID=58172 RepID=UPI002D6B2D8C|nr:hypothetical protein [Paenibacillus sp.]HZG87429.1 hypothetical protein [Paenibacillus sp.]
MAVSKRKAYGGKVESFVKKCERSLAAAGWAHGLPAAAVAFLSLIWAPLSKGAFRHLRAGCPLDGAEELRFACYFTYFRWNRRPIVFEILSHRVGVELTEAEYALFLERSRALEAQGFRVVRITDVELAYARKHVYERAAYAMSRSGWGDEGWGTAI